MDPKYTAIRARPLETELSYNAQPLTRSLFHVAYSRFLHFT